MSVFGDGNPGKQTVFVHEYMWSTVRTFGRVFLFAELSIGIRIVDFIGNFTSLSVFDNDHVALNSDRKAVVVSINVLTSNDLRQSLLLICDCDATMLASVLIWTRGGVV
jgi:hypothetical protein